MKRGNILEGMIEDDLHAEVFHAVALARQAEVVSIDLDDHHVPAVASAALQKPACRRALLLGRDHFEKGVADGQHRVDEPEAAHPRVLETVPQAEHLLEMRDQRGEIPCDEGELSDSHVEFLG